MCTKVDVEWNTEGGSEEIIFGMDARLNRYFVISNASIVRDVVSIIRCHQIVNALAFHRYVPEKAACL